MWSMDLEVGLHSSWVDESNDMQEDESNNNPKE
jgi:hypothetical protein